MVRCSIVSLLLTTSLAACSSTTSSNDRSVGVILPTSSGASVIEAPSTVFRNQPFEVVINTFGGSGCFEPQDVVLLVSDRQVVMTPFDLITNGGGACLTDYSPHPHTVRLTLTRTGQTELLVRGISLDGISPRKELVTILHLITVVPEPR